MPHRTLPRQSSDSESLEIDIANRPITFYKPTCRYRFALANIWITSGWPTTRPESRIRCERNFLKRRLGIMSRACQISRLGDFARCRRAVGFLALYTESEALPNDRVYSRYQFGEGSRNVAVGRGQRSERWPERSVAFRGWRSVTNSM